MNIQGQPQAPAGIPPAPPQPAVGPALPQQPPAPVPVAAQANNYREKYADPTNDIFGGTFINLYNEYNPANTTPLELRTALYRDGNTGALLHLLAHVRDNNAGADDPGIIVAYHRLSRKDGPALWATGHCLR
jgi:hypothetical protein